MVQHTATWTPPQTAATAHRPIETPADPQANPPANLPTNRPVDSPAIERTASAGVAETSPTVRRLGLILQAQDGASLPPRCACCGDSIELSSFRTIPGSVRYFVCREHLVSACARLVLGAVMLLIAGWSLLSPLLDGERMHRSALLAFGAVFAAGAAMAWFALPVRAGLKRDGWRTLRGICANLHGDVQA